MWANLVKAGREEKGEETISCIALIPARSGSVRVPDKNITLLNGHPLLAYSIASALESGIFDRVIASTDSEKYGWIAHNYGVEVILRPKEFATETSPDIEWVRHALGQVECKCFSILRPTSPFRTAETIKRAWKEFNSVETDSIRAVELCSQHPNKMWIMDGSLMKPLLCNALHNLPYQVLSKVYVQNASLEIAWTDVVFTKNSISGDIIRPFFTQGYEGFDINVPYDLKYAEWLIETGQAKLPEINKEAYK